MPDAKTLQAWIEAEEKHQNDLLQQRDDIEGQIIRSQQKLTHMRDLLGLETNNGYTAEQMPLREGRFRTASLRDALLTILREHKQATLGEVTRELIKGGYDFKGRSPGRVVFLGLTNLVRSENGNQPVKRLGDRYVYAT